MRSITLMVVVLVGAIMGVGINSTNVSAETESWGPQDRATFVWADPADYVTFNSMTDNPEVGDERNFVRARIADSEDDFADNIYIKPGQEVEVFVWFHNNAKSRLNKEQDGIGIAKNVRLLLDIPETIPAGHAAAIKATISADNANPKEVWDMAFANTDEPVALHYITNSAVVHLNDPGTYDAEKDAYFDAKGNETLEGKILSGPALFGEDGYGGVMLGHWEQAWGTLPACAEYSGYVIFRLKVDQPNFEISKTVKLEGSDDDYSESITAKPGDVLEFKLEYKNTGTTVQRDVIAKDVLPEGLTYIEGSTYFKHSKDAEAKAAPDGLFGDVGINLNDYAAGESAYLTYKARVNDDAIVFPCGDTVVYNDGIIGTENGTGYDKTEITVRRECTCATNPEMEGCQELPNTGPMEAIIALVIVAGLGGGGYYLYRTKRALKTVKNSINGGQAHGSANVATHHHKHETKQVAKHENMHEEHQSTEKTDGVDGEGLHKTPEM